jgi:hypothetical protein
MRSILSCALLIAFGPWQADVLHATFRTWKVAVEVFILEAILEERRGILIPIGRGILFLLSRFFKS